VLQGHAPRLAPNGQTLWSWVGRYEMPSRHFSRALPCLRAVELANRPLRLC
jgi:hypothetical protein